MLRDLARRYDLIRSFVLGAAAYLVGYLITYAWVGNRITPIADDVRAAITHNAADTTVSTNPLLSSFIEQMGGISATAWAGWVFSNAHFVPLSVGISGRGSRASVSNILLSADDATLLALFLVPPIALILAGWVTGRISGPSVGGMLPTGVNQGLMVVMGYLPFAIIGVLVFSISEPMDYTGIGPDFLLSLLVMGIVYPLVFGGLGGWLSTKYPTKSDNTSQ
jgi:hypothetical protein